MSLIFAPWKLIISIFCPHVVYVIVHSMFTPRDTLVILKQYFRKRFYSNQRASRRIVNEIRIIRGTYATNLRDRDMLLIRVDCIDPFLQLIRIY